MTMASSDLCSKILWTESSEPILPSSESDGESEVFDSDLEDLYESFDYVDEVVSSRASSSQQANHGANSASSRTLIPTACGRVLSSPLYPGALLTVFQSYLLIFQYAVRHSLTTKAFTELLQLLSLHTPLGAGLPKSVYKLKCFFIQAFPEANCIAHPYCSYYHRPLPLLDAGCAGNGCGGGRPTEFVTIPQIKRMMEGMCSKATVTSWLNNIV